MDDDETTPIGDSLALADRIFPDLMRPSGAVDVTNLEARLLEKPDDIPTLDALAGIYEQRGQTAEAIRLHHKIGKLHVRAQHLRRAVPHLSRALELNDDNTEAKALLAKIYLHLGQTTGAILLLKDLVSIYERHGDRRRLRAALSLLAAAYETAEDQINAFRTQLRAKDLDEISPGTAVDRLSPTGGAGHPPVPRPSQIPVPRPSNPARARRRPRGRAWVLVPLVIVVAVAVAAVGAWRLSPNEESAKERLTEASPPPAIASSITVQEKPTARQPTASRPTVLEPTESAATVKPFSSAAPDAPAPATSPAPEKKQEASVETIFPGGFPNNEFCFSTLNPRKLAELEAKLAACTGTIQVNGYAAQIGSEAFRRRVSEKRAECVKHRLGKSRSLAGRNIVATGHLEAFPSDPGRRKQKRATRPWVTVDCR